MNREKEGPTVRINLNKLRMTRRRKNSSLFEGEIWLFEKKNEALLNVFVKKRGRSPKEEKAVSVVCWAIYKPFYTFFHSILITLKWGLLST